MERRKNNKTTKTWFFVKINKTYQLDKKEWTDFQYQEQTGNITVVYIKRKIRKSYEQLR
jgi:hypothetical protein